MNRRRTASSSAGMLILGIVIGAGLIFGTLYGESTFLSMAMANAPSQTTTRLVTVTRSVTVAPSSTESTDSPATSVSSSAPSAVTNSVAYCYVGGKGHEVNATYPHIGCTLQFSNGGDSWVTIESCSFNGTGGGLGTLESDGTPTFVIVRPGTHPTGYCLAPGTLVPNFGFTAYGTIQDTIGRSASFSGVWQ